MFRRISEVKILTVDHVPKHRTKDFVVVEAIIGKIDNPVDNG
jgi:hypothetical protein